LDVGSDNAFVFYDEDLFVLFRGELHGNRPSGKLSVLKGTSLSDSFAPSARWGLVDGGLVAGGLDGFAPFIGWNLAFVLGFC
jgi:hypothetical protein